MVTKVVNEKVYGIDIVDSTEWIAGISRLQKRLGATANEMQITGDLYLYTELSISMPGV
jgi:hypothetical protein